MFRVGQQMLRCINTCMIKLQRRKLLRNVTIACFVLIVSRNLIMTIFNGWYDILPFNYPLQNVKHIVEEIQLTGKSTTLSINPYPKNVTFLKSSSNLCHNLNPSKTPLLIAVKSYVGQFDLRLAIRKTWGKRSDERVRLVFMVGYQPYTQKLLEQEDKIYQDIVQGDFEDKYHNNIFKTLMAYRWVADFCDKIQYILFVDDDYFVNVDYLLQQISKGSFKNDNAMNAYLCSWRRVSLFPSEVYYVTKDDYANYLYPVYPAGGSILASINLVKKFNIAFYYVKHFFIDDIYLGIVAKLMDLTLVHDKRFSLFFVPPNNMEHYFCSHGYGQRGDMIKAWKQFHSSFKSESS